MAKAVGLDIGARSIKVAELEGSAKKFKVARFARCELPVEDREPEPEQVVEKLGELLKDHKIDRNTVITALHSSSITIREITVPFKSEEQIRKVVKFEAETHLHATAIEDVVVEYVPVGETADGTRIIIFSAPKASIRAHLDQVRKASIDPRAIDLDVAALFSAVMAAGLAPEEKSVVVADLGARSTKLLVIQGGEIRAVRALRTGTDSVTRQIEADLEVPFAEAAETQRLAADPAPENLMVPASELPAGDDVPETALSARQIETALVVDHQRTFLDKVSRELTRSMAGLRGDTRIDAFYVTGGGSRSPEMAQELSDRLGLPVTPLDLLEHLPHALIEEDPDEVNAFGAVAIGLALKQLGAGATDVDFRQEEFAFARKFEILKLSLAVGTALVFLLVFLWFLRLQKDIQREDWQYKLKYVAFAQKHYEQNVTRYKRILGEDANDHTPRQLQPLKEVDAYHRALLGIQDELVNELGVNPDIPPIRSSLEVLREFFERIRGVRETKIDYFLVKSLTLSPKTLRVKGVISTSDDIGTLRSRFVQSPTDVFQKFTPRNDAPAGEGRNLDLEIGLLDPEGSAR
jgi:type IV pilus assembly protein PilM